MESSESSQARLRSAIIAAGLLTEVQLMECLLELARESLFDLFH